MPCTLLRGTALFLGVIASVVACDRGPGAGLTGDAPRTGDKVSFTIHRPGVTPTETVEIRFRRTTGTGFTDWVQIRNAVWSTSVAAFIYTHTERHVDGRDYEFAVRCGASPWRIIAFTQSTGGTPFVRSTREVADLTAAVMME